MYRCSSLTEGFMFAVTVEVARSNFDIRMRETALILPSRNQPTLRAFQVKLFCRLRVELGLYSYIVYIFPPSFRNAVVCVVWVYPCQSSATDKAFRRFFLQFSPIFTEWYNTSPCCCMQNVKCRYSIILKI